MRKPAAKSFAGWRSITACTNTSPRTQRFADGSSRANLFPPRRSGVRSGNCATTERCSCGLSLRTYIRSMWKVTSICAERGTESFFNNLPPAPQRAGGVISISWHTNHPSLSRISGISARPRSTASLLFSLCVASIPKPFPPIFTRARSWAVGAAISSGSFRWLWQTSPERSSPGSPCSGKDRRTLKYAGTASMTRRQSTNGLKTTTITLKHYATKIQTEGQLYLQRLFYPACGFRQGGRTSCFRTMRNGSECDSNDSRRRIRGRLAFRQTSPACNPGSNRSSGDP